MQAGGNLGLFPKRLAEDFETVYTFEPDPGLFVQMTRNAPEENIFRFQAALGCARDPISLSSRRRDSSGRASHEGLTHVSGSGTIPQMMIDDFELKNCDLIYLDIEGYELNALLGARLTIQRCKPVIAVEINENCKYYNVKPDELRSWICSFGYERRVSLNSDEVYVSL